MPICDHCGKPFREDNDLHNHLKAKHPRVKRAHLRRAREQSFGEELADAITAFQCGEEPPEHLAMMFPEAFEI